MFDRKNKYIHGYVRSSALSCVAFTPGRVNARSLPFDFPVQSCNISICGDIFTRIVNLVHKRMDRILARATLRKMKKDTNFYWRKIQFLITGSDLTIPGRESLYKTFLRTAALRRKIVCHTNSYSLAIFVTFAFNYFLMTIDEKVQIPRTKK